MKTFLIIGAAALASASSANIIVNGSFEDPIGGPGSIQFFSTGQTIGSGWVVDSGESSVNDNGFVGGGVTWHPTPFGNQYLYLNVNTSVTQDSQMVSLIGGKSYDLNFITADFATQFVTPGGVVTYDVVDGSNVSALGGPITVSTAPFADWARTGTIFTAGASGNYKLTFLSTAGNAGLIDDVQLNETAAVPEPASMICLGLGALRLIRKRSKR